MSKVFRAVTMWLILLAIPLQGIAAVVAPLCAAGGATSIAQTVAMVHVGAHSEHRHDPDQHHHADAQHADADSGIDRSSADADAHSGHGFLNCCSVVASLAASPPAIADRLQARSPAPVSLAEQIYQGVILDGLDRPPRQFLT